VSAALIAVLLVAGLTVIILALMEGGRRLRLARPLAGLEPAGLGGVEGALFGLLALLVAFTFGGGAQRFDARRQLIVEEANAIGTAYLRLDLLAAGEQPVLRDLFRSYVDARLAAYRALPDLARARDSLARAATVQQEIWSRSVAAAASAPTTAPSMLLLPALNEMFDVANARLLAARIHVPRVVLSLLGAIALVCALLAGYSLAGNPRRPYFHTLAFALALAVALYVIVDYEFPRLGLIRVDALDQAIVDVRAQMR
jgi:hypothetical protein